jgi:allantoin racemase
MAKALVLVPFALDERGIANRRAQLDGVALGPDITFDFRGVTAGPESYVSPHDFVLMDMAIFEAGLSAQDDGYDAVCIDTMSDSGMDALRSVLDIPVISPGKSAMLFCMMLGNKFSILCQWDYAVNRTKKMIRSLGLDSFCASVENYDVPPDYSNLMAGKEDKVFPKMQAACERAMAAGADVVCLGSTTMHEAATYLAERLPIPVINPGPLTYKLVETVLGLGVSHSRAAYPRPLHPKEKMVHAMMAAAANTEKAK